MIKKAVLLCVTICTLQAREVAPLTERTIETEKERCKKKAAMWRQQGFSKSIVDKLYEDCVKKSEAVCASNTIKDYRFFPAKK